MFKWGACLFMGSAVLALWGILVLAVLESIWFLVAVPPAVGMTAMAVGVLEDL